MKSNEFLIRIYNINTRRRKKISMQKKNENVRFLFYTLSKEEEKKRKSW